MENLIQFFDFNTTSKRSVLMPNSLSVWYNLNNRNKSFGCTFSNNIKTNRRHVKIGKLGNDICVVFTDELGITLYGSKNVEKRKNVIFNSRQFCEMIFPELIKENITTGKKRKTFNLKKINADIYVLISKND